VMNYIDEQQIISDTKKAFFTSDIQKEKYASIKDFVFEDAYRQLHTDYLVPLDIKIDVNLFVEEISLYKDYFEQWGNQHTHLPRKGLALVNQDGKLKLNDPINGSLYEWNVNHPNNPLIETDCTVPTKVMNLSSLKPVEILNGYWCRSNILWWDNGAEFKPHIDTMVPSPWIRLWAATSNSVKLRFAKDNHLHEYGDIEPGRIYVIDTSVVHDARCVEDSAAQFFLSVLPKAYTTIKNLVID